MYAKIAIGNIKRSFGDYSVYFMTLAFAACLLYSFTASTDYLLALDLSEQQRGVYDSANGVMQAFSVFSVIVFAFLIVYANRFILRRRSREFELYEILGMPASSIARILAYEGCVVGLVALVIGMLVAVSDTPLSGFVAAFCLRRSVQAQSSPFRPMPFAGPRAAFSRSWPWPRSSAFATWAGDRS